MCFKAHNFMFERILKLKINININVMIKRLRDDNKTLHRAAITSTATPGFWETMNETNK